MIKRILNIAIPNGIENGLFQLSKVALSSIVAMFGTSQIAANGVAQSFWSMAALFCIFFIVFRHSRQRAGNFLRNSQAAFFRQNHKDL